MKEVNGRKEMDALTNSAKVALIDFWANWCGPCKALAPILEKIEKDFAGQSVVIGKVDVSDLAENIELAASFGVRTIPTIFIFKDGSVYESVVGLQTYASLSTQIKKHLT